MKRFTLLLALLCSVYSASSQINSVVEAPLNNNTTGANRAPNGTLNHTTLRACYLVLQSELFNIPTGTSLTSFGFTLSTGTTGMPVTGSFTVFLENTSDITYQKGTVFNTAIASMTSVYASVMTIPVSATTTSVVVTLSSPFTYNGGGLYVAYDWASSGPFVTTGAVYLGETMTLPLSGGGGGVAYSTGAAPANITLTNSRPSFLFGFANAHTNDIQVIGIEAPGKVPVNLNSPHIIRSYIRNASNVAVSNIQVNLNVSGANAFTNSQTIASLAAGAGQLVSFAAFNPGNLGINTISVSVGSDQNNLNNSATYTQSVTCNQWSQNPPIGSYTINSVGFATGAGIIVTPFANPVASSLSGIRGAISSNAAVVSQSLCGVLMSSAGVILATTNSISVTNAMLGTFQDFSFASSQALAAGTNYYIGFAQINPSAVAFYPAGTLSSYYLPANMYSYTGIAGGALTLLTQNFGYFGIEGVFDSGNFNVTTTPSVVCVGSCATLSASGLSTYTWSGGISGASITVCPTVNATYSVIGTNTMGCTSLASISVMTNQLPNISIISNNISICQGASVSFTAGGASTYSWNTGATTATNVESPSTSTAYVVTGISANGCVNTNTVDVTVIVLNVSVTSNTTVCKGKSASLSASSPNTYSYFWLPSYPFSTYAVTPSVTTTYTVIATDPGNSCTQSNTVMVTVNANPTVSASASRTIICKGESAVLTASGAATYSWNNSLGAVPAVTVNPVSNTNYLVTGTNAAGCTHTAAVAMVVNACTGIDQATGNSPLRIFPNPTNGLFTIMASDLPPNAHLEIYNILGKLIQTQPMSSEETNRVDLGTEPNGIYFIRVMDQERTLRVARLVKQ